MNAAACLWAAERGAAASCRAWCRWQDFALMRSRAAILGKFCAPCIPKGAPDGKSAPPWQHIAAMHPKRAGFGNIRAPCIRKVPQTAFRECMARRSCQGGALFAALTPRIMHTAQISPSVAAEQRERSQARRRPYGAAACVWAAKPGAGGFLSGGVVRPREFVALWGHRALTEKPASAKRRLWVSDADRLVESREPTFAGGVRAGRRQGGAYQAASLGGAARCPRKRLFRLRMGYAANF